MLANLQISYLLLGNGLQLETFPYKNGIKFHSNKNPLKMFPLCPPSFTHKSKMFPKHLFMLEYLTYNVILFGRNTSMVVIK